MKQDGECLLMVEYQRLRTAAGGTAMKASVHQAAMVREHKWTPGGARMPLKLAMPPSTIRPNTRSRMDRHHGPALMTSVVKRGRNLLAPSPISEEDEGAWGNVTGPRRLSYSSEGTLTGFQCWAHKSGRCIHPGYDTAFVGALCTLHGQLIPSVILA